MNLHFNQSLAKNYKSPSQIIRVLSEDWVAKQSYCPNCNAEPLVEFANNQPVADFYCSNCDEEYELKSKKAKLSNVINDGAYDSMIERQVILRIAIKPLQNPPPHPIITSAFS